ncbi:NDP-hexose-3-ketoreductase [Nocardia alba]|uniref:NDP-hexose-3-ketoreductase n=1 Tax=Nocardia alba TaxID=225051 RepID=A0A4V2P9K3_9NOCA|nr:NDP-hexose-3-ketoreductase [Nocardia alba]
MTFDVVGSPVRFGVLGCSDVAIRKMIPALLAEPDAELAVVASRDGDRARALTERVGGIAVQGYDTLLARHDVDAVYIPLPAMLHARWIEAAVESGKHVLVEKPMTTNAAETSRIFGLAADRGVVVLESFTFLHHSQHARIGELLRSGTIGSLVSFASAFTIPPPPQGDIRHRPDLGGGALVDIGVYPLRAALLHLGSEVEVHSAVLRVSRATGAVISGSVLVSDPAGVGGQLSFGMEQSYRCEYSLFGTTGHLTLSRAFTPPDNHVPVLDLVGGDGPSTLSLAPDRQFHNTVRRFCAAVRRRVDLGPDTAASIRLAELLDQVDRIAHRFVV